MNTKKKLKRIYVIHCIITNNATNTINDSLLLATEDSTMANDIIKSMKCELKKSITDLAAIMASLHCNIPVDLQQPHIRDLLVEDNIEFYVSSVLLSDIRRL